ncbi:MAG: prepilin-type N-terminal cleavage/methylation domain-containing protein [Ectothiorhodospira sp.]
MNRSRSPFPPPLRTGGFSLVELMIALVLGLLVIAGAGTVFLTNQQAYRTSQALSQVQESSRIAFELLSLDVRQAGASGCGNTDISIALNDPDSLVWSDGFGIQGFEGNESSQDAAFGTSEGDRVADTDAIRLQGMEESGLSIDTHDNSARIFTSENNDFQPGEILMACDIQRASVFQVMSNPSNQNDVITHGKGGGSHEPGNCSKGLACKPTAPADCDICKSPYDKDSSSSYWYYFPQNAVIARLKDHLWYIGHNGRAEEGGRSLYRYSLRFGTEEIVAGVEDMQLRYKLPDEETWQTASDITSDNDWRRVEAVEIRFTLASAAQGISTDPDAAEGRLRRQLTHVVALRNRLE